MGQGSILIATLGGQPQVVTFALDALLEQGEDIREVYVIHLSPANPRIRHSLHKLSSEFSDDTYRGRKMRFRPIPVRLGPEVVPDIRSEVEANAAWQTVYNLITELKKQRRTLHICVAGGRRLLALLALSAAMLHFGHQDKLWHLYTPDELRERANEGAIMHVKSEDGVHLIPVPMVPWGAYFPALRMLAQATPEQLLAMQRHWVDEAELQRCREVYRKLSSRARKVLKLLAQGYTPQEVAEKLCISIKTVDTYKSQIYAECRIAWGMVESAYLNYYFLREKFAPLVNMGELDF